MHALNFILTRKLLHVFLKAHIAMQLHLVAIASQLTANFNNDYPLRMTSQLFHKFLAMHNMVHVILYANVNVIKFNIARYLCVMDRQYHGCHCTVFVVVCSYSYSYIYFLYIFCCCVQLVILVLVFFVVHCQFLWLLYCLFCFQIVYNVFLSSGREEQLQLGS